MLTITADAASVIQRVSANRRLAPESGVRIASRRDPGAALEVSIVQRPQPGDRLVERAGGRLYLAPAAADRIAGRELDAVSDSEGRVQFVARNAA